MMWWGMVGGDRDRDGTDTMAEAPDEHYDGCTVTQSASQTYPSSQTEPAEEAGVLTPQRLHFLLTARVVVRQESQQLGVKELKKHWVSLLISYVIINCKPKKYHSICYSLICLVAFCYNGTTLLISKCKLKGRSENNCRSHFSSTFCLKKQVLLQVR